MQAERRSGYMRVWLCVLPPPWPPRVAPDRSRTCDAGSVAHRMRRASRLDLVCGVRSCCHACGERAWQRRMHSGRIPPHRESAQPTERETMQTQSDKSHSRAPEKRKRSWLEIESGGALVQSRTNTYLILSYGFSISAAPLERLYDLRILVTSLTSL